MKELSLHVTDLCNFRCCFCVWGDTLRRAGERIPWTQLEAFLVAHQGEGFERVNLHGGEPTLRSDLFAVLELIRRLGYPAASIQTNGWRLAQPGFVERLIEAGVDLFVVSVHGHTPAVHDAHSGVRGSLDRVVKGLDIVRSRGGALRTNTVVTRLNYRHLPAIAEMVTGHGAAHVNISALMPSGRARAADESLMPSYVEIAPFVRAMAGEAERRGAAVTLEGFPCCAVPGLERHTIHRELAQGQQVKCLIRGAVWANHDAFVEEHCKTKGPACAGCVLESRCGGVYTAYVRARGWSEFQPLPAGARPRGRGGAAHA